MTSHSVTVSQCAPHARVLCGCSTRRFPCSVYCSPSIGKILALPNYCWSSCLSSSVSSSIRAWHPFRSCPLVSVMATISPPAICGVRSGRISSIRPEATPACRTGCGQRSEQQGRCGLQGAHCLLTFFCLDGSAGKEPFSCSFFVVYLAMYLRV